MVASTDVKGEVGNWDKGFRYSKECINSKNKWGGRSGHEGGPPPVTNSYLDVCGV